MINNFDNLLEKSGEYGEVVSIKHPIIVLRGLPGARLREMVIFENGVLGEVFAILSDQVQVLAFSRETLPLRLKATYLQKFLSVPTGMELFGHTIDPLGRPFLSKDSFKTPRKEREIDIPASGISSRARIDTPLLTGVSVVDLMIPLGKGQKELVVGDRKTGKTGFLLSVMKNQIRLGTKVVYAAIARRQSEIRRIQEDFLREGMGKGAIIVATFPHDSPSLINLTPYSAMAIAEYLRDEGMDVLLVLDDLSAHARFYREISLIAKRFPGRDSFPGDIFYIHSRLLERAGNFKTPHGNKSISLLSVVEATEGDYTGFIPTNLMSMTDGHILFDNNIFYQGQRPAINVALSVTRVGRQAQKPLIRDINKELTVFVNKYEKLENLVHFGAELTGDAQSILKLGDLLKKLFAQGYGETVLLEVQLVCLSLIWLHLITEVPLLDQIKKALGQGFKVKLIDLTKEIMEKETFKDLTDFIKTKQEQIAFLCSKYSKEPVKFESAESLSDATAKAMAKVEETKQTMAKT